MILYFIIFIPSSLSFLFDKPQNTEIYFRGRVESTYGKFIFFYEVHGLYFCVKAFKIKAKLLNLQLNLIFILKKLLIMFHFPLCFNF